MLNHIDFKIFENEIWMWQQFYISTGPNITFVYPDMETVLFGDFEKGIMKRSLAGRITATRCRNGIKEIKVSVSNNTSSTYQYMRPTDTLITQKPTLADPLEAINVYVSDSDIVKGEKGLFAQKDFKVDDLISYYSGTLWKTNTNNLLFDETFLSN